MNMHHFAAVSLAGALLSITGCSKSDVTLLPNGRAIPPQQAPGAVTAVLSHKDTMERIVEIDRFLSTPLTGTPEDADRRVVLRAERAALTGSGGQTAQYRPNVTQDHRSRGTVAQSNGNVVNYGPATAEQSRIVVAPDSRAQSLPGLSAMTPTEREQYYKQLRLTRPGYNVDIRR
jgi:hypothetical protein